ncbi:unnamed protein product [Alopecurus aequalis]
MLPYATAGEAEAALGRAMTGAEAAWLRYSACVPDHLLYCHNVAILLVVYTLAPLPLALLELRARAAPEGTAAVLLRPSNKLQPRALLSAAQFLRCYLDTARVLLITAGVLSIVSFPVVKMVGTRTGLPLPSVGEVAAQMVVYPAGGGLPRLLDPPFNFPFNPTRLIPFYGGAEHHDYHHRVGARSQSNFSSVFTFCDYLYGTDKGYKYHKASLAKHIAEGDR